MTQSWKTVQVCLVIRLRRAKSQWRKQLLRIFGPELIRINSSIKTAQSDVFLRHQPRNFENVTSVARRREHFRGLLAIFLVAQILPKRGVWVHKNSLASYQRCRHSIEPRALTCPFKQSNLSAWSCPNLQALGEAFPLLYVDDDCFYYYKK